LAQLNSPEKIAPSVPLSVPNPAAVSNGDIENGRVLNSEPSVVASVSTVPENSHSSETHETVFNPPVTDSSEELSDELPSIDEMNVQ
jgi:hypothetical protein